MSGPDPSTPPASRRRWRVGAATSNEVFVRLVVAAVLFFVAVLLAAYAYLVPFGPRSARSATPVIDQFMTAARDGNATGVHRLYSSEALRGVTLDEVAALLANRPLFDGYRSVEVESFTIVPEKPPLGLDTAEVEGYVAYQERPRRPFSARLVREAGRWRIESMAVGSVP